MSSFNFKVVDLMQKWDNNFDNEFKNLWNEFDKIKHLHQTQLSNTNNLLHKEDKMLIQKVLDTKKTIRRLQKLDFFSSNVRPVISNEEIHKGPRKIVNIHRRDVLSKLNYIETKFKGILDNLNSLYSFKIVLNKLSEMDGYKFEYDNNNNSLLHFVVKNGYKDVTRCLLNYYTDINLNNNIFKSSLLIECVVKDSIFDETVIADSVLIGMVTQKTEDSESSLSIAVNTKQLDIACELILHGAYIDSITGEDQKKILYYCIKEVCNKDFADHQLWPVLGLLAIKIPEYIVEFLDNSYYSRVLSYYFTHGHIKVCNAIISTMKCTKLREKVLNDMYKGQTPFDRVNSNNLNDYAHIISVEYMLENNGQQTWNGTNSIHLVLMTAAMYGHLETMKHFLKFAPKDDVCQFIRAACRHNRLNIVNYLWSNYQDYTTDKDGNTVLHFAAVFGSIPCVKYLCDNNALIIICNNAGNTPSELALYECRTTIASYISKKSISRTLQVNRNEPCVVV